MLKKNIKKVTFFAFLGLLLFSFKVFSQDVILTSTVKPSLDNCSEFDVALSVEWNPVITPQEVVLLIDNSGSMADLVNVNGNSTTLLSVAQDAAIDFVNNLFNSSNNPNLDNRISIISYNSFANVEIGLSGVGDSQAIINAINSIS